MLQGILRAAGLVGCCRKVLIGNFVPGRFVSGSSFLDVMLTACGAFCSWVLVPGLLVPGTVGGCAADTCLYWLRVTGLGVIRVFGERVCTVGFWGLRIYF
jgi:hypothetical protein